MEELAIVVDTGLIEMRSSVRGYDRPKLEIWGLKGEVAVIFEQSRP
jgi:hypothetical protein